MEQKDKWLGTVSPKEDSGNFTLNEKDITEARQYLETQLPLAADDKRKLALVEQIEVLKDHTKALELARSIHELHQRNLGNGLPLSQSAEAVLDAFPDSYKLYQLFSQTESGRKLADAVLARKMIRDMTKEFKDKGRNLVVGK